MHEVCRMPPILGTTFQFLPPNEPKIRKSTVRISILVIPTLHFSSSLVNNQSNSAARSAPISSTSRSGKRKS